MKKVKVLIGIISVGTLILIALGIVVARFDTIQTNTAATAELRRDLKKLVPSISKTEIIYRRPGLFIYVYTKEKLDESTAGQVLDRVKQYVTDATMKDLSMRVDGGTNGFLAVSLEVYSTDRQNPDYAFNTHYDSTNQRGPYHVWDEVPLG